MRIILFRHVCLLVLIFSNPIPYLPLILTTEPLEAIFSLRFFSWASLGAARCEHANTRAKPENKRLPVLICGLTFPARWRDPFMPMPILGICRAFIVLWGIPLPKNYRYSTVAVPF